MLASGSDDKTIRFWDAQTGQLLRTRTSRFRDTVRSLAWSPDGQTLAAGSDDKTVRLWNTQLSQFIKTLAGHSDWVRSLAWSPDGKMLASGSDDKTVQLWNTQTGQYIRTLEGHTGEVSALSFSFDGRLLASNSNDGTVRLWRSDTWELVTALHSLSAGLLRDLAFHPSLPILATGGVTHDAIHIWELDIDTLLHTPPAIPSVNYANAKVVLLGDSGVGKSALGLVLSGQKYVSTDSTHARHVWTFNHEEVEPDGERKETHETLLWDLAGQPGYRLIHQLHLNDVAVALIVFDARSETDPFVGVQYWDRALRQAQRTEGSSALPLKKFLVSARADRGGIGVSSERIEALRQEMRFDGYFQTSAKEGWQIAELKKAIQKAIDWEVLPKVSSTELFQRIKAFLVKQKEAGRLLSTTNDLYSTFLASQDVPTETKELRLQFETCIGRVESVGLIKRFSFGKLVLLQPELLDAYASALVNAVKDEPEGLGSITEERVRKADFRIPEDERIKDREQEKLLLIAMVEDLLSYELALREEPFLIFPSHSTRENPDLPDPEGKAVTFDFEGPALNIYTTLAVRLSHSELFKKKVLWKNAITYTANVGGTCGMFLHNTGEGHGELTLFFDKTSSEETKRNFEDYVYVHLQRRALPESLKRRRILTCDHCGVIVPGQMIQLRQERGFNWLDCPVCGNRISLLDREERLVAELSSSVLEIDYAADAQREREVAKTTVQGKKAVQDFDVFLCHHSVDKPAVKQIGEQLKERGILPWLDEWELRPGVLWQQVLEEQIEHVKAAAVFIGKNGRGPWQQMELYAFLSEFVNRGCPVIPVLLPDAPKLPELPIFLKGMTWVDFRKQDSDPMERLIWGITGERGEGRP
jgi:GTPase SAR1 family protein